MTRDYLNTFKGKTVLFTPLNWGLGHATRCLPLIQSAMENANRVIIASDGPALSLLQNYFPSLKSFELPSYKVTYKYESMILNAFLLAPRTIKAISLERKAIKSIVDTEKVDVIVSDNRFGCHDTRCETIFMTHQLDIQFPNSFFKYLINFQNRSWIKKFDTIWVPDYANSLLSGKLSQGTKMSLPIVFIGPQTIHQHIENSKKWDIMVLLSGPEPQRTRLEMLLQDELNQMTHLQILFVSGTAESKGNFNKASPITHKTRLIGIDLTNALNQCKLLISRSGYSTIMDIDAVEVKSILIPTPGQTEQEYLGEYLNDNENYHLIYQSEIQDKLRKTIDKLLQ